MGVFSTAQFLGAAAGGTLGGASLHLGGSSLLIACALLFVVIWFILTGLSAPPPLSRQLVLAAEDLAPGHKSDELHVWAEHLAALDGVLDVYVLDDESALMLRVSRNEFDEAALDAARHENITEQKHG